MFRESTLAGLHVLRSATASIGSAHKCLLIHGNPGSIRDWELLLPKLATVAEVVAVDLPGFGRSPRPGVRPEALALNRMADRIISVADALGWQVPFFVLGHSHGGGVAQVVAAHYPNRVAGVVLLGTLGSPTQWSYRLLSAPGASLVARAVGRLFRSRRLRTPGRRLLEQILRPIFAPARVPTAILDDELEMFATRPETLVSMVQVARGRPNEQLLAGASRIRCPAFFLHGARDQLVPVECARTIHQRITAAGGRSQFIELPGAGHMLIRFQAPEVATRVAAFIDEVR